MALSAGQLASLWDNARGGATRTRPRGQDETATAVAIALCESAGNPQAHNPKPPDNSYGLWQINMIGGLGPARRQEYGISSNAALFNPQTNAAAAVQVFRNAGNSFTPWSCYTNGGYLAHMGKAAQGAGNPETVEGNASNGPFNALGPLANAASMLTSENTWQRVGMFIGGVVLLIVVFLMMFGDDIAKVIPVGRLAKGAGRVTRGANKLGRVAPRG